jgi:hypothetical protein
MSDSEKDGIAACNTPRDRNLGVFRGDREFLAQK